MQYVVETTAKCDAENEEQAEEIETAVKLLLTNLCYQSLEFKVHLRPEDPEETYVRRPYFSS